MEENMTAQATKRWYVVHAYSGFEKSVLRALEALDLGVLERRPIRLFVFEAADIFFHDLFERNALELLGTRMARNAPTITAPRSGTTSLPPRASFPS